MYSMAHGNKCHDLLIPQTTTWKKIISICTSLGWWRKLPEESHTMKQWRILIQKYLETSPPGNQTWTLLPWGNRAAHLLDAPVGIPLTLKENNCHTFKGDDLKQSEWSLKLNGCSLQYSVIVHYRSVEWRTDWNASRDATPWSTVQKCLPAIV